jgi:hypothetical protein
MTIYDEVMDDRRGNETEICEEFYRLTAMMNRELTGPNYRL